MSGLTKKFIGLQFMKSLSLSFKVSINQQKNIMLAYTYLQKGKFGLREKPKPKITDARDAIVRVTLGSICTSDLHIKHGSVPRAALPYPLSVCRVFRTACF